jgi:sugar lactone lactonase YvrE
MVRIGGSLYLADTYNYRIRAVDISSSAVTTIAGGGTDYAHPDGVGSAAIIEGASLATDGTDLYFNGPNVIRKLEPATGTVTTIAGERYSYGDIDGSASGARFGFGSGDSGILAYLNTSLYVVDLGNHKVKKLDLGTGLVSTFLTSADIANPRMITADGVSLYVYDELLQKVYRVDSATAVVTELFSSYVYSFAMDGATMLIHRYGQIVRVDPATGTSTVLAGTAYQSGYANGMGDAALFSDVVGMVVSGSTIFLSESGNNVIRRMDFIH